MERNRRVEQQSPSSDLVWVSQSVTDRGRWHLAAYKRINLRRESRYGSG
jgi:hypothetical protein